MSTEIDTKALQNLIQKAILTVPGTITHSSGLGFLTRRPYPQIHVSSPGSTEDNARRKPKVDIKANIAVTWPSEVTNIALDAQKTVSQWIRDYTDFAISECEIKVSAVVASKDTKKPAPPLQTPPSESTSELTPEATPLTVTHTPQATPVTAEQFSQILRETGESTEQQASEKTDQDAHNE